MAVQFWPGSFVQFAPVKDTHLGCPVPGWVHLSLLQEVWAQVL